MAQNEGSGDVKYEKEKVTNNDIPLPPSLGKITIMLSNQNDVGNDKITIMPINPFVALILFVFLLAEIKPGSELSASEIQKNLQNLYEYNVMLREELIVAQSMLHTLTSKASAS